jgi:hypothetical protein
VTTTVGGGHCCCVWVTTRRTVTGRRTTVRLTTFFVATWVWTTRLGAVSATYTVPPPITAPPQVQAQSFAKAMRTDMMSHFPLLARAPRRNVSSLHAAMGEKCKTNY